MIAEAQRRIKQELDLIEQGQGHEGRLEAILAQIKKLEQQPSNTDFVHLYVYIVSALVHQGRWGGLTKSQKNRLKGLGFSILKLQGINPESTPLGFLYGDLHLALSQIARRDGEHWQALWEQQMSHRSNSGPQGGGGFQALSQGLRSLRLGDAMGAYYQFEKAETIDGDRQFFSKARMGRIQCLRLSGLFEQAKSLLQETSTLDHLSEKANLELEWEGFCLTASQVGDLGPMMSAVKLRGSHHTAVYLLEAFFWTLASGQESWKGRLPKISTIARNKSLSPRRLPFFLKSALLLEEIQDTEIPLGFRLRDLGSILGDVNRFVALDRELLFLLAATRWLAKRKAFSMAASTLQRYEALGLQLSKGQTNDVLGISKDLEQRRWNQTSWPP